MNAYSNKICLYEKLLSTPASIVVIVVVTDVFVRPGSVLAKDDPPRHHVNAAVSLVDESFLSVNRAGLKDPIVTVVRRSQARTARLQHVITNNTSTKKTGKQHFWTDLTAD